MDMPLSTGKTVSDDYRRLYSFAYNIDCVGLQDCIMDVIRSSHRQLRSTQGFYFLEKSVYQANLQGTPFGKFHVASLAAFLMSMRSSNNVLIGYVKQVENLDVRRLVVADVMAAMSDYHHSSGIEPCLLPGCHYHSHSADQPCPST